MRSGAEPTLEPDWAAAAADLERRLPGKVRHAGRRLTARSIDFGGLVRRFPRLVVEARREPDVVAALEVARAHRMPVTVRGCAHSCNGQALSDGGLVIANVSRGAEPPRMLPGERVEVAARSRWRQIERYLHRRGRTIPVLADYLDLSVGGTVSVGGYGVDSIARGALVDQVERLRLVQPGGVAVWCSAAENPELFRFSLAGLGQVGVIERVVLRTAPHRRFTALFTYEHDSLNGMVDSFEWMARRDAPGPELFKALCAGRRCVSTYGVAAATLGESFAARPPVPEARARRRIIAPGYRFWRSLTVSLWLARHARRRRLWSDYLLDHEGLRGFAAFASELLRQDAFAGCLKSIYILGVRRPPEALELPFEAAGGGLKFGVGLYSMIPAAADGALRQVQRAVRSCMRKCVELGGRPYLYGWHSLTAETLRRLYGEDHDRLLSLKQELDPDGIFQGGKLRTLP